MKKKKKKTEREIVYLVCVRMEMILDFMKFRKILNIFFFTLNLILIVLKYILIKIKMKFYFF